MASSNLRLWVSAQLHDLLGFSDNAVEELIATTARTAQTPAKLANALQQQGLEMTAPVQTFVNDLFGRTRSLGPTSSSSTISAPPCVHSIAKKRTKKKLRKSKRPLKNVPKWRLKKERNADATTSTERRTAAAAATVKLTAEELAILTEEETRKAVLALAPDEQQQAIQHLRERSRLKYLPVRRKRELELLRRSVADEQRLFAEEEEELSHEELERRRQDKKLLAIAEELHAMEAEEELGDYVMPR